MTEPKIRKVRESDRQGVAEIFNYFVETSFAAFPEKPVGPELFDRLKGIAANGSFYVLESPDKEILGFGLLKRHHESEVFSRVADLTYFILPGYANKGFGTRLLDMLVADARKTGVDTLLASISSLNETSIRFHRKNGFTECGRFERVGKKRGMDFGIVWMQRFI